MKCWHVVAAAVLCLAACGLNSAPERQAGRPFDAGASDSAAAADMGGQSTIAGSPASWPTRRRPPPLDPDKKDGGSSDTKGSSGSGATGGAGGASNTAPGGQSGSTNPGQSGPSSGGKLPPGAKGGQIDAGTSPGSTKPSNGSHGKMDAGRGSSDHDAGSGSGRPSQHGNGNQHHGSSSDPKDAGHDNGGHSSSSHDPDKQDAGNGSGTTQSSDPVGGVIKSIVDLVLAIIDISLGPAQPAEVEHLVAAILVLSLSPVELAADSLSDVLDALDQTRICRNNPAQCDPLCQDLEKECRVCDHDEDCIQHIEDTCGVHLPSSCY